MAWNLSHPNLTKDISTMSADAPVNSNANKRKALRALINERSLQVGEQMKLASGRVSNFYFNMKPTMMHPSGARLIASLILDVIADARATLVGGLEMGAVPIAASVAAVSELEGRPVKTFFVRKAKKEHGTKSLIEGLAKGETLAGQRVIVVEDVTTTGGSALKAVEMLKGEGADVVMVVTVVDRQEGAAEAFAEAGLAFEALLRAEDFVG